MATTSTASDEVLAVIEALPSRKELTVRSSRTAAVQEAAIKVLELCKLQQVKDAAFSLDEGEGTQMQMGCLGCCAASLEKGHRWGVWATVQLEGEVRPQFVD